jgi:hypothetical protein
MKEEEKKRENEKRRIYIGDWWQSANMHCCVLCKLPARTDEYPVLAKGIIVSTSSPPFFYPWVFVFRSQHNAINKGRRKKELAVQYTKIEYPSLFATTIRLPSILISRNMLPSHVYKVETIGLQEGEGENKDGGQILITTTYTCDLIW